MTLEEIRTYHKILILGYATEGRASERFLKKYHPSAEIGIADQKDDENYLDEQKHYDLAIRTPLLRPKKVTIPYTTGTRLFFGNTSHKTIGITGTKGKSTTVSLLYHIMSHSGLKVGLYGNIGTPMIDILTDEIDSETICILELSNYQLEDCEYSPTIACFLNIYEETHNHDSFDEYFQAKTNITTHQSSSDVFLYNGSFPLIAELSTQTHAQTQDFQTFDIESILKDVELPFATHMDNIRAVWAICSYFNISQEDFVTHIQTYRPLQYRLENIGTHDGIDFYNDSASIHPSSTLFALQTIPHVDTLIVGGDDRGYDMHELAEDLSTRHIPHIVCMGETGRMLLDVCSKEYQMKSKFFQTDSLLEAVEYAYTHARRGSACLLSSGAPSYGLFENLVERGELFTTYVKNYAQKKKNHKHTTSAS